MYALAAASALIIMGGTSSAMSVAWKVVRALHSLVHPLPPSVNEQILIELQKLNSQLDVLATRAQN